MKTPKLFLLLIPGVIFFLALLVFFFKMSKPEVNKIENIVTPTPAIVATPAPSNKTPLQQFIDDVGNLAIPDPQLTRPNFDRKISLPAEK